MPYRMGEEIEYATMGGGWAKGRIVGVRTLPLRYVIRLSYGVDFPMEPRFIRKKIRKRLPRALEVAF